LIADDQHPVHPGRPRDDQALPEDLGGVAPPAVLGQDAVADVAAPLGEMRVEREPDRCPAHDVPRHVGDQEGARHMARGQANPVPVTLLLLEVTGPRLSRPVPQAELEALGGHGTVPGDERRLVIVAQRPQPQRPRARRDPGVIPAPGVPHDLGGHRARLTSDDQETHLSFRGPRGGAAMLVAFSVTPLGVGDAVGEYVADAVRVVRDSGLPNHTDAMFTTVEGDWDEVMAVVKRAVDAVAAKAPRVSVVLKADIRPGAGGALTAKVESLERHLGG